MTEQSQVKDDAEHQESWKKFQSTFDAAPRLSQSTFAALTTIRMAVITDGLDAGQKKEICYAAMDMHSCLVVKNTLEVFKKTIIETGQDLRLVLAIGLEEANARLAKAARKAEMMLGTLHDAVEREIADKGSDGATTKEEK